MAHSFYITLPSNVIGFTENRISDFLTRLPTTLRLSDEYQVALTEITYTKSWYNVRDKTPTFTLSGGNILKGGMGFQPRFYRTIEDLISNINENIRGMFPYELKIPQLALAPSGMVRVMLGSDSAGEPTDINLDAELENMLGLANKDEWMNEVDQVATRHIVMTKPTQDELEQGYREGSRFPDIKGGIHSLFVYSDIVAPSIVGNTYSNFLRCVSVDDKANFGDDVNIVFQKPYYHPVSVHDIDTIRINIKDDSGQPIEFFFGRVCVTLHFKKVWKTII